MGGLVPEALGQLEGAARPHPGGLTLEPGAETEVLDPGPSHVPIKALEPQPLGILDSRPCGFWKRERIKAKPPCSWATES